MAFDHMQTALDDVEDYPVDVADRFVAALQQFVWGVDRRCERPSSEGQHAPDSFGVGCPTESLSTPLSSPRTSSTLQALDTVLRQARHGSSSHATADPVTEAGLFMMRLTRLLEHQTLARLQHEMNASLPGAAPLLSVQAPPSTRQCCSAQETDSATPAASRSASVTSSTVRSCGRRYTVPAASLSCSPSPSTLLEMPSAGEGRLDSPRRSSLGSLWRFHAELTLELQQCLLQSMCLVDTVLLDNSADDGGLCGILTHPRAARLQGIFVGAITDALGSLQRRWGSSTAEGADDAAREVGVVLERLRLAATTQPRAGAPPQLQVYELCGTDARHRSPPPFASRRRSLPDVHDSCGAVGTPTSTTDAVEESSAIQRALGSAGADYAAKLVAQQLWCAQKLLAQRFPSYAAPWDILERTRCFVEATRSPTPTVPRSDSAGHGGAYGVSATPSPERGPLHDGDTPPPCIAATQQKGERPPADGCDVPSPPQRSLSFSEGSPASADAEGEKEVRCAESTASPVRLSTVSALGASHADLGPHILPAARCSLWENYLSDHGIPVSSTLLALRSLAGDAALPSPRRQCTALMAPARLGARQHNELVSTALAEASSAKRGARCSVETAPGSENAVGPSRMRVIHARST